MVKKYNKSNKSGKKKSASKSKTPKRSPSAYEEVQERDLHLGSQGNSPERASQTGQAALSANASPHASPSRSSRQASRSPPNGNESEAEQDDSSYHSQAFGVGLGFRV